jgi:hypothetical protein
MISYVFKGRFFQKPFPVLPQKRNRWNPPTKKTCVKEISKLPLFSRQKEENGSQ